MPNKTFSAMAQKVDEALQYLRDSEQRVKDAEQHLNSYRAERDNARVALDQARDELFLAHPELAPAAQPVTRDEIPVPAGEFEFVETDDPDELPQPKWRESE